MSLLTGALCDNCAFDLRNDSPIGLQNEKIVVVAGLTTTSQKLTFGTTSPSITIGSAGTYLIMANITVDYNGLTNAAVNTCSFKLRRTNNTAADLSNATSSFKVPVVTLLTQTAGDADIQSVIYTTANTNDVIEMWGNRALGVSLGSIDISAAHIIAVRIA